MARRKPLLGVQQAGRKIALTLEAIANMGKPVRVPQGDATIVDHTIVPGPSSPQIRYRVRVPRVGFAWLSADNVTFN